jgi:hypothetical protein
MSEAVTPATPEEIAENTFCQGLYCAWLQARAAHQKPEDDDKVANARADAPDEAARQLLIRPAIYAWQVWIKWEVLDFFLDADSRDGQALDRRTIVALACIKADLIHFGFGK